MSFVASDSNREASLEVFSPSTATEWKIVRTLGEGTFASVKLAVNTSTNEALAIKITGYKTKESENEIKKEISIHKIMNHPNIVKFIGQKKFENSIYILLEYVNGGELFDRIEPNIGMPEETAKKYLVDIVNALTYIHKKGIVHRDIKPENCLVGSRNEIKITDFGLSTIYFYENKHRILQRFCGTHPYMAPEVFNKKDHLAEPIDVWSVGITFIALLSELPWKKPSTQIEGYKKFATKLHKFDEPWNKLSTESFNFIKKLLKIFPEKRWTLKNIIESEYLKQSLSKIDENAGTINNQNNRFKVMKIPVIINRDLLLKDESRKPQNNFSTTIRRMRETNSRTGSLSQPEFAPLNKKSEFSDQLEIKIKEENVMSFSQPLGNVDILQSQGMPDLTQISQIESYHESPTFEGFVRRMTRLFFANELKVVVDWLVEILKSQNYFVDSCIDNKLKVTKEANFSDKIIFSIQIVKMEKGIVLCELRRISGCGIEFKKCFLEIKKCFSNISESMDLQKSA